MKDKSGRVIVNRDQCIYCSRFSYCHYKLYSGKPADCPEEKDQHEKTNTQTNIQ